MSIFALAATATLLTKLAGGVEAPPGPGLQAPALALDAGRSFGGHGSWVVMAGLREELVLRPATVDGGGFSLALQVSARGWVGHYDGIQVSPSAAYDLVHRTGDKTFRLGADWIAGGGAWGIGPTVGFEWRSEAEGRLSTRVDAGVLWRDRAYQAFLRLGVSFDIRFVPLAPLMCLGACLGPGSRTT